MKAELNEFTRTKKYQNYEVIQSINDTIAERIKAEYNAELTALKEENETLRKEEKAFEEEARKVLMAITPQTKIRIKTQVGKNGTIVNTYEGHIEYKLGYGFGVFNMVCATRYDGKPFTIGMSCLVSIEVLD